MQARKLRLTTTWLFLATSSLSSLHLSRHNSMMIHNLIILFSREQGTKVYQVKPLLSRIHHWQHNKQLQCHRSAPQRPISFSPRISHLTSEFVSPSMWWWNQMRACLTSQSNFQILVKILISQCTIAILSRCRFPKMTHEYHQQLSTLPFLSTTRSVLCLRELTLRAFSL